MSLPKYSIDGKIESAETLPASFYNDPSTFEQIKDRVFYQSWQWIGDDRMVRVSSHAHPFVLLDGFLTEPMVLTCDETGTVHCLSNVCTHRGNIVVPGDGNYRNLMCMYHGRKFGLDGAFKSMPEFKEAKDFPRPCEGLYKFPLERWGPLLFAKMGGSIDLASVIKDMNRYVGFLPLDDFTFSPAQSKDYLVNAHWALYCDNYLEGFHIPFVHQDLNEVLDYGSYETIIGDHYNLQVGYASGAENTFQLPAGHVHEGRHVGAYYFWLFPNMMFNFYPWGLSINIVRPLSMHQTKVSFLTYVYDESKLHAGAGALLDKVEREDEFVVEGVQKGLKSRYYTAGRFSPTRETGVHRTTRDRRPLYHARQASTVPREPGVHCTT